PALRFSCPAECSGRREGSGRQFSSRSAGSLHTVECRPALPMHRNQRHGKSRNPVTVAAKMQRESRASWPDDRLVAECLQGDEKAWSALVDKYKNLIFSIPIKLGLYDDAADIFQAVCLVPTRRLQRNSALPQARSASSADAVWENLNNSWKTWGSK